MVCKRASGMFFIAACALVLLLATELVYSRDDLSGPVWTNGQFQFTLNYWEGSTFVIESSPDLVNWTPVLTNTDSSAHLLITLAAPDNLGFYRAIGYIPPLVFAYALAAQGIINLNANGVITDSWNSHTNTLSTNGLYIPTRTSTNGDVASEQGLVNIGDGTINGSLYLGPSATFSNSSIQVTGTIYSNYDVQFPDVRLPTTDSNGNDISWQPAPVTNTGTAKKPVNVHDFTSANSPGTNNYFLVSDSDTIVVEAGVTATVQVTNVSTFNPASITINGGTTNSGTLVMYDDAGTATLGGNSSGGAIGNRPDNFIFLGLPGLTSITFGGTSTFVGAVYAPEATLTLNGGGNNNNLEGSAIVNSATVNSHYTFHFDESLLTSGPFY